MQTYYQPRVYRICVDGQLPERSIRWFEGYIVVRLDDGNTTISGIMDQAALHGVLNRIRDLRMELISMERME